MTGPATSAKLPRRPVRIRIGTLGAGGRRKLVGRTLVSFGALVAATLAAMPAPSAAARIVPVPGGGRTANSNPPPATGGQGRERVPGSSVNERAAAAWALANLYTAPEYFGDDCTDFVSQALLFGGGDRETGGWPPTNDQYWYLAFGPRGGFWYTHSWSVAHDLAVHLELIHSYWIRYWRDASPGDVIFADWSGSSFAGISHVGVITEMRNGQPLITQHTPSQRNVSLNYWLTRGGRDVHVWIAVPNMG